jgi:hypothetical protein
MAVLLYGRAFATQVLLTSLLIFAHPFVLTLNLAHDRDVQFWCGGKVLLTTVLVPVLFVLLYFAHTNTKRPRREGLYCSFIVPCVFFFFVGFWLLFQSANLYDRVVSDECGANELGRVGEMEKSWQDAARLHSQCWAKRGHAGRPLGVAQCEEYGASIAAVPGRRAMWEYLEHLERASGCAGWCERGPHLWVSDWGDLTTCADVVAENMRGKVTFSAHQLMVYAIVVLCVGLVWMLKMRPLFRLQTQQLAKDHFYWYVPSSR